MLKFAVRKKSSELFHEAVDNNEFERVKILLKHNQTSSHFNIDDLDGNGLTALQRACFTGSLSLVQLLVAYGANIKIKDKEGWTILHAASVAGNFKIAKFLISLGIDTAALNDQGELPIDLASDQKTVTLLARVMLKGGHKELVVLCLKRHPEIYEKVFKPNNVDMSQRNFSSGLKTRSVSVTLPPHIEEECSHVNSHCTVNGNHKTTNSFDGRLRSESALDQKNQNALQNKIWTNSASTGSYQRPDLSPLSRKSSSGVSSLSPTSSESSLSSSGSVFLQGNSMNFWDRELCLRPLENIQTGSENKLKSFSKEDEVISTSTESHIHSQIQSNVSPRSRRMKRQHAEITLSTNENSWGEARMDGAKVRPSAEGKNSQDNFPNGNVTDIVSRRNLITPPTESVKTSRNKTLELCALIKAGILNINKLNEGGISALHQAAKNGNIEWVRLLLELGAEVNRQSLSGSTPLHEAVKGNNLNCVKYLIERGADLFAETDDGFLAIDQSKNPQIARLLQTAMAIR